MNRLLYPAAAPSRVARPLAHHQQIIRTRTREQPRHHSGVMPSREHDPSLQTVVGSDIGQTAFRGNTQQIDL